MEGEMASKRMEQAIIAVSFGTSFNNNRSQTIGAIESTLAEAFPEYTVRRAFTSGMIISKLKKRDGICIDNLSEALDKLAEDGFTRIYLQPTHIIEGEEFEIVTEIAKHYRDRFECVEFGHSLLATEADREKLIDILDAVTEKESDEETARIFMGHGTGHNINTVYTLLQRDIEKKAIKNMFIGTVEARPTLEDLVKMLREKGFKKVLLSPLMIVAGDHASKDMAGDDEDSWKSVLQKAGYEVKCRLIGLGSEYEVQQMIVEHCKEMLEHC